MIRTTLYTATGIAALALALPAAAQDDGLPALPELPPIGAGAVSAQGAGPVWVEKAPMSQDEIRALPAEYRNLAVGEESSSTAVGADGVETITRTRRIEARAPAATAYQTETYYQAAPVAYQPAYAGVAGAPIVLDRASWIEECERRTRGRDRNSTGTIIGGLLGAIGGGVLGNRLWDSERLAGTLIGGGVGGLAGALIGSLFNGDKKDALYDCEAALTTYLDQYGQYGGARIASRVIPAPAPVAYQGYPAYSYGYGYAQPGYYQPQPTMVMVPVTTYQQQRVLVRETTREETYEAPAAVRNVPAPAPVARPVPLPAPTRVPAPLPSPKLIKN